MYYDVERRRRRWTFPARGTWIEITPPDASGASYSDVPRKGNVDRNLDYYASNGWKVGKTFPARGTWIEISI